MVPQRLEWEVRSAEEKPKEKENERIIHETAS
jgi:hypothetical protein